MLPLAPGCSECQSKPPPLSPSYLWPLPFLLPQGSTNRRGWTPLRLSRTRRPRIGQLLKPLIGWYVTVLSCSMVTSTLLSSLYTFSEGPIRADYSGHVISLDQSEESIQITWSVKVQSEASVQVTWSVWTNQRSVFSPFLQSSLNNIACRHLHRIGKLWSWSNKDKVF